jgi:glucose/arabinose dehydrogenase
MIRLLSWMVVFAFTSPLVAADPKGAADASAPAREDDYYRIVKLPIPKDIVLEAGVIELLPGKKLAYATRRGEIYLVENAWADDVEKVKFKLFASGLHEVLGMVYKDGAFYVVQRPEVTRITDTDGDDRADLFETVSDGWGITGDYHEYAFGSEFDKDGNLWVVLCLTGSFNSNAKYRGWCLRITPEGKVIPTTSGVRSPGGIGLNAAGDVFYTDNQGPWNGSCVLKHLVPGKFVGHPGGFNWYDDAKNMGPKPTEPQSGSRWAAELAKIPELVPPACWFPYPKMGQSASGIVCDRSAGKFGPFADQLFVGDQSHSTVMRVALEKVNGFYQGAVFPFRQGFGSGTLTMKLDGEGSMFVGGTNRGWGSRGRDPWALERLVWTGKTPFEVHTMNAKPDGFELTFTEPVDPATAGDPASYKLQTYTYIYQSSYGSPEVDHTQPKITAAKVAADGKSVRLTIDGLVPGHVHELHSDGVRSKAGAALLHPEAYYTLNFIPAK